MAFLQLPQKVFVSLAPPNTIDFLLIYLNS